MDSSSDPVPGNETPSNHPRNLHSGFLPILLIFLGFIVVFPNLGNRYLWDDEAETAILSRNILKYGVPKAYDGVNLVSQLCGEEFGSDYVWRNHPWLPMYLTAASF